MYAPNWLTGKAGEGGEVMLFIPGEEGQGLTEYAMILILVAVVVVLILLVLGPEIGNMFSSVVAGI